MKKFNFSGTLYDFIKDDIKGSICFDIGSNIGEITKKLISFGCKCVSVEPQEELTINNENYKNVLSIKNVCINSMIGKHYFYKCKNHTSSSCSKEWLSHHPNLKWDKIEVPVTTIDELIKEFGKPKYIKLDIENLEYEALKGLSQRVDIISIEYTEGFTDNTIKCIEKLDSFGIKKMYTFTKKKNKKLVNGKLKTIDFYNIVTEFENKKEVFKYLKSLPKLTRKYQGDLLFKL